MRRVAALNAEGNGEIRESTYAANWLLGVSNALEFPVILLDLGFLARFGRRQFIPSLPGLSPVSGYCQR